MVCEADIEPVLRSILDPEMPVNIVDLGIVHAVRVQGAPGPARGGAHVTVEITPTFVGCPALDLLARQIRERVGALPGVLEVRVDFVYSPAWTIDRISEAGREALRRHGVVVPQRGAPAQAGMGGAARTVPVTVSGSGGRGGLHGASAGGPAPTQGSQPDTVVEPDPRVACPYCGGRETLMESAFGPTRCRMIYYCPTCRNSFEYLKDVRPG